jgi:hypothetical protein
LHFHACATPRRFYEPFNLTRRGIIIALVSFLPTADSMAAVTWLLTAYLLLHIYVQARGSTLRTVHEVAQPMILPPSAQPYNEQTGRMLGENTVESLATGVLVSLSLSLILRSARRPLISRAQIFISSLVASATTSPTTAKTLALSAAVLAPLGLGLFMLVADRCRMRGLRGFFTRQQERQPTANLGLGSRPALGAENTARPLPRAATVCCSAAAAVPGVCSHTRAYLCPSAHTERGPFPAGHGSERNFESDQCQCRAAARPHGACRRGRHPAERGALTMEQGRHMCV